MKTKHTIEFILPHFIDESDIIEMINTALNKQQFTDGGCQLGEYYEAELNEVYTSEKDKTMVILDYKKVSKPEINQKSLNRKNF